ncbi:MAG TPA: biopolymer transporter ExbD [Myxococcota bacterium]|nr:biopolymer transporter ExbD [Myxococcota bacterium]
MRRISARTPRIESTGIDLAPMLDFVLNLLIFFIITAVFTRELGIEVSRPGAGVAEGSKESKSLIVQIQDGGVIVIDDRVVDVRAVRANVERMHAVKPENGVMVVANKNTEAGLLVQVIDQIRQGGVQDISFGATK